MRSRVRIPIVAPKNSDVHHRSFLFMNIQIALQQFCEYSSFIRGYSNATISRYKSAMKLLTRVEGLEELSEATPELIRRFMLYGRSIRKWSANSFVTYHKTYAVFFRWCIEQGYMEGPNPADGMEMPKVEKKLPPKLTRQEAMRILETAYNYPYKYKFLRSRNHAIFSVFILAGLRKGELLALKFADVDIENRTIFIRQGKGAKDRIVPMSSTLQISLERYLKERQRLQKTCPEFFASLSKNVGFTGTGMKRLVANISKASGIKFSAHKLRHTFATLMLEGGCDIYSLSRMMGHADISTTTIYLAASAEHLRTQINKHPLDESPTYNAL